MVPSYAWIVTPCADAREIAVAGCTLLVVTPWPASHIPTKLECNVTLGFGVTMEVVSTPFLLKPITPVASLNKVYYSVLVSTSPLCHWSLSPVLFTLRLAAFLASMFFSCIICIF